MEHNTASGRSLQNLASFSAGLHFKTLIKVNVLWFVPRSGGREVWNLVSAGSAVTT